MRSSVDTVWIGANFGAAITAAAARRRKRGVAVSNLTIVSAAGLRPVVDPSNVEDRFDRARMRKALAVADWLDVDR